jgi:SEC-C motif domain protein
MMCPCHSGRLYQECCAPYHEGKPAPTPLALMRSRYSGYALKKIDYIIETEDVHLRRDRKLIEQFSKETTFDGLDILKAEGDHVTFRAHLSRGGKDVSFTEKSHFKKVDGKWKYYSGMLQ